MVNVNWPDQLRPIDFGYYHIQPDTSGGASLSGTEQAVMSMGSRWGASMTLAIRSDDDVLAIRALRAKVQGRANPILLPNFDGRRVSWPLEAGTDRLMTPRTAHIINGTWRTGSPYSAATIPPQSQILATVSADASIRATQIKINITQGGPLKEGQQFGLLNFRLHEIADIVSVVGSVTTVNFLPPLRFNVAAGTAVQFERPVCLMRCININEQTQKMTYLTYATLALEFEEFR